MNKKQSLKIVKEFLKENAIPAKKDLMLLIEDNIEQIIENENNKRTLIGTVLGTAVYAGIKHGTDYKISMKKIADFFCVDNTTISKCYRRN